MTTNLNEVPEHMAQEYPCPARMWFGIVGTSMKFLSTWLRNFEAELPEDLTGVPQ